MPFIRILPAFCLGVILSFYFPGWSYSSGVILILSFIAYFILNAKQRRYQFRHAAGISLMLAFASASYLTSEWKDIRSLKSFFAHQENAELFHGVIAEPPVERNGSLRAIVCIRSAFDNKTWKSSSGKIYVYFRGEEDLKLLAGDDVIFKNKIIEITGPLNPGEFDFRRYASLKRIYHQAFLNKGDFTASGCAAGINLRRQASVLRQHFLETYVDAGIRGQEYAVLAALVLGYDDEIDREIMNAFSASGTLHVLSVSGMHVGIVFAALSALLSFLRKNRKLKWLYLLILIVCLWFYALLTGFSPSVVRSAMMFSFIIVGQTVSRSGNIFNSLSLSALCIFLFIEPLMLFEPGLQLSYLAVAGIACFYPVIKNLFTPSNFLLEKIWSLTAVSIAAQGATFGLSLFYFHQFPNYFIPANLIIIPLSTIGIFAGIGLLFIHPFHSILSIAGTLVSKLLILLNASALMIERLPFAVTSGISISLVELFLINGIIIFIFLFFTMRSVNFLYAFLITAVLCLTSINYKIYSSRSTREIVIFSGSKNLCYQVRCGFKTCLNFHQEDSLKAIKYSNAYLTINALSPVNRSVNILDSISQFTNRIETSLLFCNSINILNESNSKNIGAFYVVNDRRKSDMQEITNTDSSKLHRLSKGCFRRKL